MSKEEASSIGIAGHFCREHGEQLAEIAGRFKRARTSTAVKSAAPKPARAAFEPQRIITHLEGQPVRAVPVVEISAALGVSIRTILRGVRNVGGYVAPPASPQSLRGIWLREDDYIAALEAHRALPPTPPVKPRALEHLTKHGPASKAELAEALGVPTGAIARALARADGVELVGDRYGLVDRREAVAA